MASHPWVCLSELPRYSSPVAYATHDCDIHELHPVQRFPSSLLVLSPGLVKKHGRATMLLDALSLLHCHRSHGTGERSTTTEVFTCRWQFVLDLPKSTLVCAVICYLISRRLRGFFTCDFTYSISQNPHLAVWKLRALRGKQSDLELTLLNGAFSRRFAL